MTREEAARILRADDVEWNEIFDSESGLLDEALDMAIKALEQQPCEYAVSRQAVLETIEDCNSDGLKGIFCSYNDGKRFEEYIKELLPVTPKEKTGHWIRWYETIEQEHCTIHDPHCKCSECNQEYDTYIASLFNYCPNCGAKMIEPQESEDKE